MIIKKVVITYIQSLLNHLLDKTKLFITSLKYSDKWECWITIVMRLISNMAVHFCSP